VTVAAAAAMKVKVAKMLLFDSRAIPAIPCPEVHPWPIVTPMPTRKPPRAVKRGGYKSELPIGLPLAPNRSLSLSPFSSLPPPSFFLTPSPSSVLSTYPCNDGLYRDDRGKQHRSQNETSENGKPGQLVGVLRVHNSS
jgi:hypothetical protein